MRFKVLPLQKGSRTPVIVSMQLENKTELAELIARLNMPYALAESFDHLNFMKEYDNPEAFLKLWRTLFDCLRTKAAFDNKGCHAPNKYVRFKNTSLQRGKKHRVTIKLRNKSQLAEFTCRLNLSHFQCLEFDSFNIMKGTDDAEVFAELWRALQEHLLRPEGVLDVGTREKEIFW